MNEDIRGKVSDEDMLRMTTEVVSANVGNNMLPPAQNPEVIRTVYSSLRD